MKKHISILAIFASLFFLSCGDDDVIESKDLVLDKTEITLVEGMSSTVLIKSGNGDEKAYSMDKSIAKCKVIAKTVQITGVKKGKTEIRISDSKKKNFSIIVNVTKRVSAMQLGVEKATVLIDKSGKIKIFKGSGDFSVISSDETKVTAKINNRDIDFLGVALGESVLTITDNKTKETVKLTVHVKSSIDLKISKEYFVDFMQEQEVRVYNYNPKTEITTKDVKRKLIKITSGSGLYSLTVEQEGPKLINASINDGNLLVESDPSTGTAFMTLGVSTVNVLDKVTGQSEIIKVRVVHPLRLSKKSLTVQKGKSSEYITFDNFSTTCGKCTIDYINVVSNNTTIAVSEKGQDGIGTTFRGFKVIGKELGTTKMIVSDGVREDIEVTVNVVKPTLPVQTGDAIKRDIKKNDIINLSTGKEIKFKITGSNDYSISYSPDNLITDTFVKGANNVSSLTLKAGFTVGTVEVTIIDNVTGQKNNFTVNIEQGNVYNCDKDGEFKHEMDYKDIKHDETPIIITEVIKNSSTGEVKKKLHNCIETITMNVGDVLDVKFCGGYVSGGYDIYQTYMIKGVRRSVVKLFKGKDKLQTTSTITALDSGELVIYVRGYKKRVPNQTSVEQVMKKYRIIVK